MARRPPDTAFSQQKLDAWQPKISVNGLIFDFFIIGLVFIPLGVMLLNESSNVKQYKQVYDAVSGMNVDCSIKYANYGGNCSITFEFTETILGPIYVYYELTNYYQNNRRYIKSTSESQLLGQNLDYDDVYADCYPLVANGSQLLNPCGLIANSFFTDIISLVKAPEGVSMDETSISWPTDINTRFEQVDGFVYQKVPDLSKTCVEVLGDAMYADCKVYEDQKSGDGTLYYYWYPDDDNVQYLHESFPNIVSPIEGVKNEHFINWMRTAGLPHFRKLYGRINSDVSPGDTFVFDITTNFEVVSISGSKALVLTTLADYGGQNYALGKSSIIIGAASLFVGVIFALKRILNPRPLGDIRHLFPDH